MAIAEAKPLTPAPSVIETIHFPSRVVGRFAADAVQLLGAASALRYPATSHARAGAPLQVHS